MNAEAGAGGSDKDRRQIHAVLVTPSYSPSIGGIATYVQDLATVLAGRGHRITVVVADNAPPDHSRTEPNSKIEILRVDSKLNAFESTLSEICGHASIGYSHKVARTLCDYYESSKFDIVEFPNWRGLSFFYSQTRSVPIVLRVSTGIRQVIASSTKMPDQNTDEYLLEQRAVEALHRVEEYCIAHSDLIITPTMGHWRTCESYYELPRYENVDCIPFGIALPGKQASPKALQHIQILFIGRLSERKGFDTLLEAVPAIFKGREERIRLVVAGIDCAHPVTGQSMWTTYSNRLPEVIRRRVTYLGPVDEKQRLQLLGNSHVLLAPSRYESFGLVYVEAMAYGVPVIGCSVGGVDEVVENGRTGFTVAPGDARELAQATITLIDDDTKRQEFALQGRLRAAQLFDREQMADATLKSYMRLLSSIK